MATGKGKSKNLIAELTALNISGASQTVRIVPVVRLDKTGVYLSLKVGENRLYLVKDFAGFFQHIIAGEEISFGKNYILNCAKVQFSREIMGFINLMSVLAMKSNKKDKEFHIEENMILPVMQSLIGIETEIVLKDKNIKNASVKVELPQFEFETLKQESYCLLKCEALNDTILISKDARVIFAFENIYILTFNQAKIIFNIISNLSDGTIVFDDSEKHDLITKVLPYIRRVGKVHIDSEIKKEVIVGNLKIKTYLDKAEFGTVSATVTFCYGNEEFNHFQGEKPKSGEKILLRDAKKENEFIRLAARLGFVPDEGMLYLSDEYKLYDFLNEGIYEMKELSEIFYSDRFNIDVITPTRGNGGVSLSTGNILQFSLSIDNIDDEEIANVMEAVKEKRKFYHLKSGSFVKLDAKPLSQAVKLIESLEADSRGGNVSLARAFFLDGYDDGVIKISGDNKFDEFINRFKSGDENSEIPEYINNVLRPYQRTGVKWMKSLARFGMGGILADEMGLGKTLQTIAFVMSEYEDKQKPTLIIVPTSLIFNWRSEIERFAPEAKTVVLSGPPEERKLASTQIADAHFVITSYGLLRNDIILYSKTEFAFCFIDEAQHIKNPNTLSARFVKQIKAENFFALTGTPLENTLLELWSVFDFIMPGYLYSRHKFRTLYEFPIVKEKDADALKTLQKHIKPFILRRLKSQVMKELPEKIENYMPCELTQEQKKLYLGFAARAKEEVMILGENGEFEKNRIKILALITRLRQLCCHPSLFIENYSGESGKLNLLKEVVESGIAAGHRMLIFSQFTSMLGMISDMLHEMGISHYYLDGSTKSEQRFNMVKSFNEGMCDIFLVSLRAGGTGLNLTGADMVIHFDPWWNPAVENQATDRAHRIGQTKVVQVLKLVTLGTIEEKICELKKLKQKMVDSVLETGETMLSTLTFEEIKWLFNE